MVSVIIATYKRDSSLFNALKSLEEQTYKDFEVVIIDDNACEEWNRKVGAVVSDFKHNLKINYIQNESNLGSAKARNIGILASRGDYITFLDDDDLYYPNKIMNQLNKMIETDADYSLSNLSLYNEDESLSDNRKRDYLVTNESSNLLLCHLKYHMTGTDTMMFKKEYILSFGGFEEIDVGDEFYLMMKAIQNGGKFIYCNCCDVKAYVHTGNGGLSSGRQKIDGEKRLYQFKKKFFSEMNLKDKRYIMMRHFAVLAYAFKRGGRFFCFLFYGFLSVMASPLQCFKMLNELRH